MRVCSLSTVYRQSFTIYELLQNSIHYVSLSVVADYGFVSRIYSVGVHDWIIGDCAISIKIWWAARSPNFPRFLGGKLAKIQNRKSLVGHYHSVFYGAFFRDIFLTYGIDTGAIAHQIAVFGAAVRLSQHAKIDQKRVLRHPLFFASTHVHHLLLCGDELPRRFWKYQRPHWPRPHDANTIESHSI